MTTINNTSGSSALTNIANAQAAGAPGSSDVGSLVQWALRQAYLENTEDLKHFAEKVKFHNAVKKEIRGELSRLRDVQAHLAGCWKDDGSVDLEKLAKKPAPGAVDYNGTIPDWGKTDGKVNARFWVDNQLRQCWGGGVNEIGGTPGPNGEVAKTPGDAVDKWWQAGGKDLLDNAVTSLEEQLSSVGDDAQLANVDLQNGLQRMQQTLQMMTNISKQIHDGAMNTIRKIGG